MIKFKCNVIKFIFRKMEDKFMLEIIAYLIVGGLIFVSVIKGLFTTVSSKEAPKSLGNYVSAGIRARDPYKGSGKPLLTSILGNLWVILLFILGIPKRIVAHFLPQKLKWVAVPINVVFWLMFVLYLL